MPAPAAVAAAVVVVGLGALGVLAAVPSATAPPGGAPAVEGEADPGPAHGTGSVLGPPSSPTGRRVAFTPPLPGAVVVQVFDAPAARWGAGHRGVDLHAPAGTTLLAPAVGVVTFAGTVVDRPVLSVTHPDGHRSTLEPVTSELEVGASVAAGQELGVVATAGSHCAPQSCLHWGVRLDETYVDPLSLLAGGGPTVLLPVP